MRRMGLVLAVVFGLVLLSEFLLPMVLEEAVARGMKASLQARKVTANLDKVPAVGMLTGAIDKVTLTAEDARPDNKIGFSEIFVGLTDVRLDMGALMSGRTMKFESVGAVETAVTVTQEEFARFLNQSVKNLKNATVTITPGLVQARGQFSLGGIASVAITLEGRIIGDGQKIAFVTDRFLLNNTVVGSIGGNAFNEIALFDLKKLPFAVSVRKVDMIQGKVVVYADNGTKQGRNSGSGQELVKVH